MTLAMMWRCADSVVAVADSAVTWTVDGTSGPTVLGQRDVVKGKLVRDRAMKLWASDAGVLWTAAGSSAAIHVFADVVRYGLGRGIPAHECFRMGCEYVVSTFSQAVSFSVLFSFMQDSKPVLMGWRPTNGISAPELVDVGVIGNVSDGMRQGFGASAHEMQVGEPLAALVSTQAFFHSKCVHDPDFLQRGIGGAFCGAVLGPGGLRWQPDLMYVFVDPTTFGSSTATPTTERGESTTHIVASLVRENGHFVRSSFAPEGHGTAYIFLNDWAPSNDDWQHRWNDELEDKIWRPECMVFISLTTPLIVGVPAARHPACPVQFTKDPLRLAVEPEYQARIARSLTKPPLEQPGTQVSWLEWLPRSEKEP